MIQHFYPILILLKRLGVILFLFTVCRILFLLFTFDYFNAETAGEWIFIFVHGIRFDISAILYLNLPFIFLHILPLRARSGTGYQKALFMLFSIMNTIMLFANLADMTYFDFTFKRSTSDSLIMFALGGDFIQLLPTLMGNFWYLIFIWILLIVLGNQMYKRIKVDLNLLAGKGALLMNSLVLLTGIVLIVIGGRGGLQYKPIGIIDAGNNISSQNMALVLNTPFSIITTYGKEELNPPNYFSDQELNSIYSPVVIPNSEDVFSDSSHTNVVIIVLESFSSEYSAFFGDSEKGYLPFFDSLAALSLSFDNCFANGKKSIEAIPAILASLPTLMNNPYITSVYAGNRLEGLAALLSKRGYSSAFYHGGSNGTMGYDAFASVSGFEKYMGRTEYDNEEDYDGEWGIYDEEFFQFFLENTNKQKEPFFNCIATLSSHHPYSIPDRYLDRFEEGTLEIHQSLQYADFALRRFFEDASKTDWYHRTLFVLTADHTESSKDPYYLGRAGMYDIPLLFFQPNSALKGVNSRITQHIDIMPSILDYLGYEEEYLSFGQSVFNDKEGFAVNFLGEIYQLYMGDYILQFDREKSVALFNYKMDGALKENMLEEEGAKALELETKLKAIIQSYNERLTANQLTVH
ncbi:MAG TPA: alkaline phosphatase family protein [Flavobacteriales bacterium]|nr:alkaline phosphatase family protein [Flavobacteriales bacterium]